jgi:protoheme IX farnesyltransferase
MRARVSRLETHARSRSSAARDIFALTKPHIVLVNALVAGGGMVLAPATVGPWTAALALLCIGAVVGGAGAINMFLEREHDRLMPRTSDRPLPARRLGAGTALVFGLALSAASLAVLALWVNLLTAALGLSGLLLYTLAYTPLKRRTCLALPVGAVAGALPPLMGWTAATGAVAVPGLVLAGTLFLWQLPHFLAIAIHRREEYARAGFRTVVSELGPRRAWVLLALFALTLVPVSLLLVPVAVAGCVFFGVTLSAGLGLAVAAVHGLRSGTDAAALLFFRATLVFLPLLALGLVLDRLVM